MSQVVQAELVLKSDAVFTGDGLSPFKGGVAIADGKIVACGDDLHLAPFIGPDTDVREFGDRLIMPGIIDSHTHFAQGAMTTDPDFCVNLIDCTSFEQVMERMQAFAESHPDNEWLVGVQAIQFQWEVPEMPSAKMIDAYISDRPVFLSQVDMHTFSANTCAIEKVGVTRDTPDPVGGKILKDENGDPTGVFSNNAGALFMDEVYNPPLERARESFAKTAQRAVSYGITSVGAVNPTFVSLEDPYRVFADMNRAGEFPLRVFMYTDLFEVETMTLDEIRAKYDFPDTTIEWNGFKQFIDGVCSDHTAWMLDDYSNAPGNAGEPAEDPERVRAAVLRACEWGVLTRIHAIGDRSVRYVLDCFEEAERLYGKQGLRHCMEHDETVQPEDLPRFAQLGISACMQPWHMLLDMGDLAKDDAVGPERAALSWPIRSLMASGANVSLGSDFPVVGIEPMEEVYGAVYRMLEDGSNPEGWFPEERITMAEALRAYTYGSAYAMGVEDRLGTLAVGKEADVCVLSRNLFECEPAEVLDTVSELTVSGGKIVYEA
ncbi:MAG: amidohydrolase [Collinsella sp.]|nr:amidohydrolase [Collinsella sp.]